MTIMIADDHPLFRMGLRIALERFHTFRLVAEAVDGTQALQLAQLLKPQLAVLDIQMPKLNGLQVATQLAKHRSPTRTVLLTNHLSEAEYYQAKAVGIAGILLKETALNELDECLQRVAQGLQYLPRLTFNQAPLADDADAYPPNLHQLTATEKHILTLIAEQKTTTQIALLLGSKPRTVEKHRFNICHKLNLEGKNSLLTFALSHRHWLMEVY